MNDLHDLNERMKDPFNRIRQLMAWPSEFDERGGIVFNRDDQDLLVQNLLQLKEQRDKLREACRAMLPIVIATRTIKGKNPDECPVVCMARAALSDGNEED